MHVRLAWPLRIAVLPVGIFLALSLTRGQEQPAARLDVAKGKAGNAAAAKPAGDFSKLNPLQKQIWLSAQRGAEWLYRANAADGRFAQGVVPSLRTTLEGDSYLQQAAAAGTLAQAARFSGEPRYAARATQAIVALLADTVTDERDPQVRHTAFPTAAVNRIAAAGLMVLAIHELPDPDKDLLAKSEQLCNFLHKQQQGDGSLHRDESADTEAAAAHPGMALYGLMRSQQRQPVAWKTDFVRNALVYYKSCWRKQKSLASVPWQTAAFSEAFLLTKERPFADFVFEMNDWLAGLQYHGFDDPKQVYWSGGFKGWADGRAVETMPRASSARCAEALAEACRIARTIGDLDRHKTYSGAVERCLSFLTTLQYTEANTQHFAEWYRPTLLGGFHASPLNGDLTLDDTQHAVSAMVDYLTQVVRVP